SKGNDGVLLSKKLSEKDFHFLGMLFQEYHVCFLYLQVNLIHFSILLHEFCTEGLRSFKFQENSRKFRELAKKRK
ncbi:hypothetical protein, partial [Methanosarcina mazei]|uniref:hypothetical protein n=1 Tax=Methanosarcina mazei TaxID=2209 RepID=UPI00064EFDBF